MLFDLKGRVAVVTGASSGLGEHFSRVLADAGVRVLAAARRFDRLERLAAAHGRITPVECDITDSEQRKGLIENAVRLGGIDILVNNAGAAHVVPALEEDDSSFTDLVNLNLTSPFALCRMTAATMISEGRSGSIVNVASVLGLVGSGRIPQAGYCASKGGLISLTRELALQWARSGIRVNAIAPGFFESEMTEEMLNDDAGTAYIARNTPLGRPGRVDELDGALLFLVSDASSYVTGHTLTVDGGWTII